MIPKLSMLESKLLRTPFKKKLITSMKTAAVVANCTNFEADSVTSNTPIDFYLGSLCVKTLLEFTWIPCKLVKQLWFKNLIIRMSGTISVDMSEGF